MKHKIIAVLQRLGLGIFVPFVRLATGEEPGEQVKEILTTFMLPTIAIVIFLVCWSFAASKVKTSIGELPGPKAVYTEAQSLMADHNAERAKEDEFYTRQEKRKAAYLAQFPDKEWTTKAYTGKPTFIDNIVTSLYTVFAGFLLAALIAVPIGILCGLSKFVMTALNPIIQVLKPVSPVAWVPLTVITVSALYTMENPVLEKAFVSSAIVVCLCSLWPTLINTAMGVSSIDPDHLNVAKVLKLGWWTRIYKIVIPSALPFIFTGLRISLGIGWMVLIAVELLVQNPGLGKFVWDAFQNGSSQTLAQIMVSIVVIGVIGFFLDRIMFTLQKLVSFDQATA